MIGVIAAVPAVPAAFLAQESASCPCPPAVQQRAAACNEFARRGPLCPNEGAGRFLSRAIFIAATWLAALQSCRVCRTCCATPRAPACSSSPSYSSSRPEQLAPHTSSPPVDCQPPFILLRLPRPACARWFVPTRLSALPAFSPSVADAPSLLRAGPGHFNIAGLLCVVSSGATLSAVTLVGHVTVRAGAQDGQAKVREGGRPHAAVA